MSDLILTRIEAAAAVGTVVQQQNLQTLLARAQEEQKAILREILEAHELDPDSVQIVNVDSDTRVAKLVELPSAGPKIVEMPKADEASSEQGA